MLFQCTFLPDHFRPIAIPKRNTYEERKPSHCRPLFTTQTCGENMTERFPYRHSTSQTPNKAQVTASSSYCIPLPGGKTNRPLIHCIPKPRVPCALRPQSGSSSPAYPPVSPHSQVAFSAPRSPGSSSVVLESSCLAL